MSVNSLLPDNRTLLETALEKSLSKQLSAIDSPFPDMWNPQTVPNHLLPYLAHAKGVPDWGDDTEQAKRNTVANIWPVQRKAGTKKAIKQAVAALGFDADVQRGEQPYHLQVDLWREDVGTLEADILGRAHRRIANVKSERDVIALTLNASADGELNTAVGVLTSIVAISFSEGDTDTAIDLNVGLVNCASITAIGHSAVEQLQTDLALNSAIGTANHIVICSYPEQQSLETYQELNIALGASVHINQTITECY